MQGSLVLLELGRQVQEMRGVLGDVGALHIFIARDDLLEELRQLGVAPQVLRDVVHHDGVRTLFRHLPEPGVAVHKELPLRIIQVACDHEDHAPRNEWMHPIEPAAELHIAEGEVAEVIFPSSKPSEGTIHGSDDAEHRHADGEKDLRHQVEVLDHHRIVKTDGFNCLLQLVLHRCRNPAPESLIRRESHEAEDRVVRIHDWVARAQVTEDEDQDQGSKAISYDRCDEGHEIASCVQG
mmetsp:Transcript_119210/g.299765  ORF Transcript_119210/g.299765 Transcript_119210/m.299765 type:complete len:238 (-) Transcript_119210:172-885(-)